MEVLLEKLEKVLASEVDAHDELLASVQELNTAIKNEDIAGVDCQRAIQDKTLCVIEKLEEQRIECCSLLTGVLGIEKKPLRMSMLLEKLPQHWRERLGLFQERLKEKINSLTKVNLSNRILLEEGLRMVEHTFFLMRQPGGKYTAYGTRGQAVSAPAEKTLFNRTI